jgi:RHS repeat-associated protein
MMNGCGSLALLTYTASNEQMIGDYQYQLDGVGNRVVVTETLRQPAGASSAYQTTRITYTYDPLYRLTGANYSGSIAASYTYVYDAAGNMTLYGDDKNKTRRTFNAANQLILSESGDGNETVYIWDNAGRLTEIRQGFMRQYYSYNQRSLLTSAGEERGGPTRQTTAYAYDGDGNRVQQVDYTGAQPVTTIFTNDNLGLSQVLIADDGMLSTANLYGLDLIIQQQFHSLIQTQPRTLLTDGLGSVRQEMAGGAVETVTTYEPYGRVLAQTGQAMSPSPGTVYGFTGEQHDVATGLLYLRARYYNPGLRVFTARDSYPGSPVSPSTQHGYSYVSNNPVNKIDPSGLCEEWLPDEACWGIYEEIARRYPDALNNPLIPELHAYPGKELHELPAFVLGGVLRNLNINPNFYSGYSGPPPSTPKLLRPDAVSVYASIHGAEAIIDGQTGIEVVYNLHSADLTLFVVVGFGGAAGADLTGQLQFMAIYNIGSKNLDYSGNFVGLGGQASAQFGLSGQYSITPRDARRLNIFTPEDAFSIGAGPTCGYGLSVNANVVEYIPIATTNLRTHKTTYHLTDYFYDSPVPGKPEGQFDNGFITGLATEDMPRYYRLLRDKIEEYGWDEGRQ